MNESSLSLSLFVCLFVCLFVVVLLFVCLFVCFYCISWKEKPCPSSKTPKECFLLSVLSLALHWLYLISISIDQILPCLFTMYQLVTHHLHMLYQLFLLLPFFFSSQLTHPHTHKTKKNTKEEQQNNYQLLLKKQNAISR